MHQPDKRSPEQKKDPDHWKKGPDLSLGEQSVLVALAKAIAALPEPRNEQGQEIPGKFKVRVKANSPDYCFLDYEPWVYIC